MGQSVYESIEGNNNEAYAKLRETALQPETGVDASSLGQLRDAIKSDPLRRRTAGIDVDGTDDLILYGSQRKPLCSPLQSPFAPLTTAPPSMAPGIGGFNIDAPKPERKAFKGHIAVADIPASPMQNFVSQAPLQAQRMAAIVESGETSLVPRLFAVIAIAGLLLLGFHDKIRNHLSYSRQTITPLCNVFNADTSVR
jgi:hypothetical protein